MPNVANMPLARMLNVLAPLPQQPTDFNSYEEWQLAQALREEYRRMMYR